MHRRLIIGPVIMLAIAGGACAGHDIRRETPPLATCTSLNLLKSGQYEFQQIAFLSEGLRVGAILTKPVGKGPFPAYIHNHGSGVQGSLWAFPGNLDGVLAQAGYVVLRPARRGYLGSEGWTTTYTARDSRYRASDVINGAYDEASDVTAAFSYLSACPFVDAKRIAVGGHSLGGLVTIIAAARLPTARAFANINGGITWVESGVETGHPAVEQVWWREVPKVRAPVLVLQGDNDTLIPPDLTSKLVRMLQKQSVPVEWNLYPGGHGFFPVEELVRFLDKHVKP